MQALYGVVYSMTDDIQQEHKTYNLRSPTVEVSSRPYAYEVSLDTTAKGWVQPSVKVRSDCLQIGEKKIDEVAIIMLDRLVNLVKSYGYKVATDIEEVSKNQNGKD